MVSLDYKKYQKVFFLGWGWVVEGWVDFYFQLNLVKLYLIVENVKS